LIECASETGDRHSNVLSAGVGAPTQHFELCVFLKTHLNLLHVLSKKNTHSGTSWWKYIFAQLSRSSFPSTQQRSNSPKITEDHGMEFSFPFCRKKRLADFMECACETADEDDNVLCVGVEASTRVVAIFFFPNIAFQDEMAARRNLATGHMEDRGRASFRTKT
jgi:hypothetical protein